jgi:hypothetical protein
MWYLIIILGTIAVMDFLWQRVKEASAEQEKIAGVMTVIATLIGVGAILMVLAVAMSGCWYTYSQQPLVPTGKQVSSVGWGYDMHHAVRQAELKSMEQSTYPMVTVEEDVSCIYRALGIIPVAWLFPLCRAEVTRSYLVFRKESK